MKNLLLTMALLLMSINGQAAVNEGQTLVVSLIDGSSIELSLSDTPRLRFPGTELVIEATNFSTTMQRYRVVDVRFAGAVDVEGIASPTADAPRWQIDYTRTDEVVVTGPMDGHRVSLYTAGGALLRHQRPSSPTQCRVDLTGLQAGSYIITVDGITSFKVSVR